MKNILPATLFLTIACFLLPAQISAREMSKDDLVQELQAMKARLEKLETNLQEKDREVEALRQQASQNTSKDTEDLGDRVRRIEEQMTEGKARAPGKWADRVRLSGAVEVEAAYEEMDFADPVPIDTESSDITLATVELGIDVDIARYVQGHALLLWEEDDTGPVDVDEGYITLGGVEGIPLSLTAGKMYVPFGSYESHFVSDPLTLEIGETNERAVALAFLNDWVELSAALYNGNANELDDDDDHIDGFAGSAVFSLPEGLVPDFGLHLGASYLSNLAESDGLEGETPGVVQDDVTGLGVFLSASCRGLLFLEAEYIGAVDSFEPGELAFDNGLRAKPRAWNLELALVPVEKLELGVKYEGSEDMNDFLPESQLGGVASYEVFEHTTLSLEYLHGSFENDDERNLLTTQLAIEF